MINLTQKVWLKLYIDLSIKLKTEAKYDFQKDFFKLMINSVFGKTKQNNIKHTRLVTTDKRTSYLVLEPNYNTTKWFSGNFFRNWN